jgi:hypothetical protein
MTLTSAYIYKKEVDWSVFRDGFDIPVSLQVLFYEKIGQYLQKGGGRQSIRGIRSF